MKYYCPSFGTVAVTSSLDMIYFFKFLGFNEKDYFCKRDLYRINIISCQLKKHGFTI